MLMTRSKCLVARVDSSTIDQPELCTLGIECLLRRMPYHTRVRTSQKRSLGEVVVTANVSELELLLDVHIAPHMELRAPDSDFKRG